MLRGVPQAATLEEATAFLRGNWLDRIQEHHAAHSGGLPVRTIVDVGCATGISTRFLADRFASADEVVVRSTALGSAAKLLNFSGFPL
jgi:2-polyprenyl-3-methyl-5-hydroxy-6-metoxy-1,4-benzoquinol methylase